MISKKTLFLMALLYGVPSFSEIHTVHAPLGIPENPEGNDLVFGHLYTLSNDPNTKMADWVVYQVTPINYGVSPGRNWSADPLLDENETLEPADYKKASAELGIDRGHQAPLASFAGSRYWYELNYLSNITPQDKDLNQGPWRELEQAVRDGATYRSPLFVITGPIFNTPMEGLPEADEVHKVPSGYFKVIYNAKGDSISFLMEQSTNRNADYCSEVKEMGNLRRLLEFKLPESLKDSGYMKSRIGC